MSELISPDRLVTLGLEQAAVAIRPLFEDSPWLAEKLTGQSFSCWTELIDRSATLLEQATEVERQTC